MSLASGVLGLRFTTGFYPLESPAPLPAIVAAKCLDSIEGTVYAARILGATGGRDVAIPDGLTGHIPATSKNKSSLNL